MISNPQTIIRRMPTLKKAGEASPPDAIFLPFRQRPTYVRSLLRELQWYEGPIYLMPSDINDVVQGLDENIRLLNADSWFAFFFSSLRTSRQNLVTYHVSDWDLPIKRSYAIWFARVNGFERVLLVDDDIRGLRREVL